MNNYKFAPGDRVTIYDPISRFNGETGTVLKNEVGRQVPPITVVFDSYGYAFFYASNLKLIIEEEEGTEEEKGVEESIDEEEDFLSNCIDPNYLDRNAAKHLVKAIALTKTSSDNVDFLEYLFEQINIALDFGCHIDSNGVVHSPHRHYKVSDICLGLSEVRVHNFIKSLIDDCLESFE